jgi:multimeric flavodoxin WrbA
MGGEEMGRMLVIYHSQQFGNTKALAEALGEGLRQAGAEVELINTNEQRVTLDKFLAADAVGLGTPDYFSYLAGTIKTFFDDLYLWDQAGNPVKGKPAVLFFSHGGGGKVRQPFEYLARRFFQQVGETVEARRPVSKAAIEKCLAIGQTLVRESDGRVPEK